MQVGCLINGCSVCSILKYKLQLMLSIAYTICQWRAKCREIYRPSGSLADDVAHLTTSRWIQRMQCKFTDRIFISLRYSVKPWCEQGGSLGTWDIYFIKSSVIESDLSSMRMISQWTASRAHNARFWDVLRVASDRVDTPPVVRWGNMRYFRALSFQRCPQTELG